MKLMVWLVLENLDTLMRFKILLIVNDSQRRGFLAAGFVSGEMIPYNIMDEEI